MIQLNPRYEAIFKMNHIFHHPSIIMRDTNLSPVTSVTFVTFEEYHDIVSKFPFYEQARQAIPDEREWDVRKTQEEYMNEGTGTCFIND